MSNGENNWYVAASFAGDLVYHFFSDCFKTGMPTKDGAGNRIYASELNDNIFGVITYFTELPTIPRYKYNYFPRGYNALDFLHYCGKVVSVALRDCASEIHRYEEFKNHAAHSITLCLTEFMNSGEFESKGGWWDLKEMSCKLSAFHVFRSVVCLANYFSFSSEEDVVPVSTAL